MAEHAPAAADMAPFTRSDKYGELGMAPLSVWEKIRLVFLGLTVLPIKMLGTMVCLFSFWLCCRLSFLLPSSVRSDTIAKLGNWHCRCCLFWIGFWRISWVRVGEQGRSIGADGKAGSSSAKAVGIVSNHIGWCDILIHMSHSFPSFVARDKTRHLPIVGVISYMMGCMYVDRDAIRDTNSKASSSEPRVSDLVRQRMQDTAAGRLPHARPLLLFPEGTTTNGRFLLPFKTGAFLAGEPLQPVVLRYGEDRISPAWEMIPAVRHILLMLCEPLHSVTCFELPVYVPSEAEKKDPKLYAHNVRKLMMDFSGLQDSRVSYTEKMAHMRRLKAQYGIPH